MTQSRTPELVIRKSLIAAIATGALVLAASSAALAGPTLGFTEEFPAVGGTAGFAGGAPLSNPGTGGRDGAGDGYLRIARDLAGPLACYNAGPDYGGDYIAAGVTRVVFWLNDVDSNENLEIHLVVGNAGNFWLYNQGFAPPEGSWAAFEVDLTDSTNFTQIRSFPGGPYTLALSTADRLHWRHDTTPYSQRADGIAGQFGLDGIFLTNNANAVVDLPAPPVETIQLAAFPNPAAGVTSIATELIRPAEVQLRVVAPTGRIVREIFAGHAPAGPVTFPWDGRDSAGLRVSAGTYFLELTAGTQSVVGRVVIAP